MRKKILFVGASGKVAELMLPILQKDFDIVGISLQNENLKAYCIDFYTFNLHKDFLGGFETIFNRYLFYSIIWNPVVYFKTSLKETSREKMLTELDIAVAIPIECLKIAKKYRQNIELFIFNSSGRAVEPYDRGLATYAIAKNAQIKLTQMINQEPFESGLYAKAILLKNAREISTDFMSTVLEQALSKTNRDFVIKTY